MDKIKLQVLRPMMLHGVRQETGTIFSADAADASALTESGRCRMLDPADEAPAKAAGRKQTLAKIGQRGPTPPDGWPWRPA